MPEPSKLALNDESVRLLWQIRCCLSRAEPQLADAVNLIDEALKEYVRDHQLAAAGKAKSAIH